MKRQMNRRPVRRRATGQLLAGISALALAGVAKADDYFINTAGGDWFTPANWSNGVPPTTNDDAYVGYDFGGTSFSNPANLIVTFSSQVANAKSLYSKSNLLMTVPDGAFYELRLSGTTLSMDPAVSLSLAAAAGATPQAGTFRMYPSAGSIITINANINQGDYTSTVLGKPTVQPGAAMYGAGFTWNVSGPHVDNSANLPSNLDATYTPFILNGTLNLSNGAYANFGNTAMAQTALTVGASGVLNATSGARFDVLTMNNQGHIVVNNGTARLGSVLAANAVANYNSGSFDVRGGGQAIAGVGATTNTGSFTVSDPGSRLELNNVSGNGSITASNGAELDLLNFDNALVDHVSSQGGATVAIGGTITVPTGQTFDFRRLGPNVTFGVSDNIENVSFTGGGAIAHSEQLQNVVGLSNVTLDHGLNVFEGGPLGNPLTISGTVNAGDQPIALNPGANATITGGAVLNGDVTFNGPSSLRTLTIAGTLNGNVDATNGGTVVITGDATLTSSNFSTSTNTTVSLLNGHLKAGTHLDLTNGRLMHIGNFAIDNGANVTLASQVYTDSSWTNAGTVTLSSQSLWIPNFDVDYSPPQPIVNTGTMLLPAGGTLGVGAGSHAVPINNSGTFTVAGRWEEVHNDARPVSNTGNLTITSSGEADAWNLTQSAGKTLVNGLLYSQPDNNTTPHGTVTLTGGTLAGSGTINWYDATATAGVVLPGDEGAPGQMSFVNSTLHLSGSATLKSEIADGTHFGNLAFSGTGDSVILGGTLEVDPLAGSNVSYGETFTLISADALSGTFDALDIPQGWQVNYGATSVTVTALPEPAGLSLLMVGGVLCRRRRRKAKEN